MHNKPLIFPFDEAWCANLNVSLYTGDTSLLGDPFKNKRLNLCNITKVLYIRLRMRHFKPKSAVTHC